MNVLLIQPPDPPAPVESLDFTEGTGTLFSPPWNMMCLQTYLQKHSRHMSRFVDGRLFTNVENDLVAHIESVSPPRVMVINCPILALGQVSALMDIAKRRYPHMRTVLVGEYPSQFPDDVASMPRVDFGLSGDPEPILRNLLDYIDVEQRLRRIPGLIIAGSDQQVEPYWLPKLNGFALPDWHDIFWGEYLVGTTQPVARAEVRLTRGHTRTAADRASGGIGEPFRVWPMDRVAPVVQKCSHIEVNEIVMTDPPGFWTLDRIKQWGAALENLRNAQKWTLTILPMELDDDAVSLLQYTKCRRIEMLFPTCDRNLITRYESTLDSRPLRRTLELLNQYHIQLNARFWVGGPEEGRGETERIVRMIRRLGYCPYSIESYPFTLDSPLYRELAQSSDVPHLEDWTRWCKDPWLTARPVPIWGGAPALDALQKQMKSVQRAVVRSPGHLALRLMRSMKSHNWIDVLEDKAVGWLQRMSESAKR